MVHQFLGSCVPVVFAGTAVLSVPACGGARERVFGVYARETRTLVRIDYDRDADGRIDARTYMHAGKPVRLEADVNGDGFVERWEYYDANGALLRIGGSTRGDGREDTWVRTEGRRRLVETSTARDGRIDRREVFDGETLLSVDIDDNRDGRPDRWEEYRAGALVRVMFDEEQSHGRPTRRISYDAAAAEVARVEADPDGDGHWEPVRP